MTCSHAISRNIPVHDLNWKYYLEMNTDVVQCMGYSENVAKEHFINYGFKEGRIYKPEPKKYFLLYDDETGRYNLKPLIDSIQKYSSFEIIIFKNSDISSSFKSTYQHILSLRRGGGYWLWKPYIIHETLKNIEEGSYLFYIDTLYTFVGPVEELIQPLNNWDVLVWKNKPNGPAYKIKSWCKMHVIHDCLQDNDTIDICWAGALAVKNTLYTRSMIEEWLNLCCRHDYITDSPSKIPNSSDFIEHRHDQSLLTIALHHYNVPLHFMENKYLQDMRNPW